MRKLTPLAVEAAKAKGNKRTEIADGGARGLYLICQPPPSRAKSWAVRYRVEGRSRKLTLGDMTMTLAQARAAAAAALEELEAGRDPALSKLQANEAEREQKRRDRAESVEWACEEFITKHAMKKTRPSTWKSYEQTLRNYVLPAWRGRSVHEIRRRDVLELIESIEAPYAANRLLATLSAMFNWLASRDVIVASALLRGEAPAPREGTRAGARHHRVGAPVGGL